MLGCFLWGSAPHTTISERRRAGWVELLLLLLPVLSGWALAQQSVGCPDVCECSQAARTVKCINKNLTEVPRDLPHYVQNLFLTGNNISSLLTEAFLLPEPLLELSHLNLRDNNLVQVEAHALAGLPSLKQLDLGDNSLTLLSPVALGNTSSPIEELNLSHSLWNHSFVSLVANLLQQGNLPNLKHLDLSNNHLLFLPEGMFSSLPSLQHLDLHNNSLVSLHDVSFQGLHQLQSVNLSDNSLKNLKNSTLLQLQNLTTLSLGHNPWVCDCNIEDLVIWLNKSNQVEAKEALKCSSPHQMQNSSLVKIDISDLNCSEPTDINAQLQTSYVFLGIVLALIGAIFLLVLYLNRKGIKKWMYNIRDACRDHMEGYHYRYEINADPRLTNLSSNSDV